MIYDHGNCPKCGTDLNGGSIWEEGYERARQGLMYEQRDTGPATSEAEAEALADKYAKAYGADRERGQWGRAIGVYDMEKDCTTAWQCPDCGHTWRRE